MAKIAVIVELSGDGLPVSFRLCKRRFEVRELMDSWYGADHAYFRVVADDGNHYVLRHDLEENEWEMVLMEAQGVKA